MRAKQAAEKFFWAVISIRDKYSVWLGEGALLFWV